MPHFLGIALVAATKSFQQQNYALDVQNCIINQILISTVTIRSLHKMQAFPPDFLVR